MTFVVNADNCRVEALPRSQTSRETSHEKGKKGTAAIRKLSAIAYLVSY